MAKLRPFGLKVRTPDEVRADLVAAGWKPMMAFKSSPHPDPEVQRLLLELYQANVLAMRRRMKV